MRNSFLWALFLGALLLGIVVAQTDTSDSTTTVDLSSSSEEPSSSVEPTTSSEEPTTSSEEPTTSSEEPTTSSEEPTTSSEEPTTSSEEPTTSSEEPTTSSEEPTTSSSIAVEPTTSSEEPSTTASPTEADTTSTPASSTEGTVVPPSDCDLYFVPAEIISPNPNFVAADGWTQDVNGGAAAVFAFNTTDGLYVDVTAAGTQGYNLGLMANLEVVAGTQYQITFTAKTEPERSRVVEIVTDNGPDGGYNTENYCGRTLVTLTQDFQSFNICCTPTASGAIRFILEFGAGAAITNPTYDLYISQFQMASGALVLPPPTDTTSIDDTVAPTGSSTEDSVQPTTPTQTNVEEPTTLPEISSEDPGISGGALAAIIIVIIAVILAVIIAVVLFWKFRDSDDDSSKSEEMHPVKGVAVQGEEETESSTGSTETESESESETGSGSSESESGSTGSSSK